ncbi:MAG: hypothetical protein JWR47_177, partial [Phenylobacterium sp.]|nr:hypothetical protein [Phenylobacterium sp.]
MEAALFEGSALGAPPVEAVVFDAATLDADASGALAAAGLEGAGFGDALSSVFGLEVGALTVGLAASVKGSVLAAPGFEGDAVAAPSGVAALVSNGAAGFGGVTGVVPGPPVGGGTCIWF